MIINRHSDEFEYEGVTYKIGAPIVGMPESEYAGLFGIITEIRDGEDKDTENETPDLYCTFDPPALPCDVKTLEETFSELYEQPKTLDDIILDCVIMAPSMIKPLDYPQENRHTLTVYVLHEDWTVDGEHGSFSEVYTDFDDAKYMLSKKLLEEQEYGCIFNWSDQSEFVEESTQDSYEAYLDGEYMENHYTLSIASQRLCTSDCFLREAAELHRTLCQLEDFVSQIHDWDELGRLTEEQYQRMIQDRRFSERLEKALGRNDYFWESYWESVSEVAHELVNEYLQGSTCSDDDEDEGD